MTERFGFWQQLQGSLGDAAAYRRVAAGGVGSMLGYLTVLVGAATVAFTVQTQVLTSQTMENARPWVREHFPEIRITQGVASSPVPQPYTVWAKEGAGVFIDTTGATTSLDPNRYRQGMLLTRTELLFRKSPEEERRYSLAKLNHVVLTAATVEQWLNIAQRWLWVVVGVALFIAWWIALALKVLFWSLLALLVNAVAGRALRYEALFSLGVYALTVPFLLDLAKNLFGWRAGALGWASLGLYVGYLIWGILAQPKAADAPPSA